MACDIPTLITESACFDCKFQGDMYLASEIVLLCAIRDGETVDTDPDALLEQAACILCQVPRGLLPAIKLTLLCHIANGT